MNQTNNVQAILSECKKSKTPVFISSTGLDVSFQTVIRDLVDGTVILENNVRPEFISRFAKGDKFFLQCKMLRLQSATVKPRGVFMAFDVQDNSVAEETRQSERFMFTPDEKVVAEITNPYHEGTLLRRNVMDMSATGLSLRVNLSTKPFAPGTQLPKVVVTIDGKIWTTTAAEVVYNRKFMDLDGILRIQVGLKFLSPEELTKKA